MWCCRRSESTSAKVRTCISTLHLLLQESVFVLPKIFYIGEVCNARIHHNANTLVYFGYGCIKLLGIQVCLIFYHMLEIVVGQHFKIIKRGIMFYIRARISNRTLPFYIRSHLNSMSFVDTATRNLGILGLSPRLPPLVFTLPLCTPLPPLVLGLPLYITLCIPLPPPLGLPITVKPSFLDGGS